VHRVNVTYSDEEWKLVKETLKKLRPYQPVGTTLKEISLHAVTRCNVVLHGVTCPEGGLAGAGTDPDPEKNKKKKRGKDLCSLEKSEKIIGELNRQAGTKHRPRTGPTREVIQARINEGATDEEFFEVIRKKVSEWKDNPKMRGNLNPQTLFNRTNFSKYLGSLDAGPAAEKPQENWLDKLPRL
jgi:uncharacterized phage protein (TIGR02220 family)